MLLVKKYPNRRLYDTRHSRYITLDDLEKTIRAGEDVAVQDAQDGRDLTQETLTQIILDRGGGKILPSALLLRMIRLDDAALGEFLTRYVSWALEVYLQAKGRARALLPLNPLATAPFAATDALARLVLGAAHWGRSSPDPSNGAGIPPPTPLDEPPPPPLEHLPLSEPYLEDPLSTTSLGSPTTGSHPIVEMGEEVLRLRHELEVMKESLRSPARARSKKKGASKKAAKRGG